MKSLIAMFENFDRAEDAVKELQDRNFNISDISVIVSQDRYKDRIENSDSGMREVAGNAASGATTGGVIGGIAGLLIGIGAIAIPGIGGILIGGPLAAALGLTGAAATTFTGAATGALAGGIVGALRGLGLPEDVAQRYESRIGAGAVLVAVNADEQGRESEARDVLETHGAEDIRAVEYSR